MLDTDVEGNPEHYVDVTDRLYGGNSEHRLRQELLLGVGGVRALRAYCRLTGHPAPEVFHTNEGHAGFLGLERIRELTVAEDGPRSTSTPRSRWAAPRTVFTTHTPVPAGIDRFPRDADRAVLRRRRRHPGRARSTGSSPLGAEDYEGGDPSVFNMAVMGFRLAQRANGVSLLHGEVSRGMFNGLWPAFDEAEVPIGSITNGVHAPTWVAREVIELAVSQGADPDADDAEAVLGGGRQGARPATSGRSSGCCASAWSSTPAGGCASRGWSAVPPRPSSAGSTPRSTPTC